MNTLITIEQLKSVTGYNRPGDIERCLRGAGVRFLHGKDGKIFTTVDAINAAMGLKFEISGTTEEVIDFID